MNTSIKIAIAAVGVGLVWYAFVVVRQPAEHAPQPTPRPSPPETSLLNKEESEPELRYETIAMPQITLQEFTAPHLALASPAHKDIVILRETTEVRLAFDAALEAPSKILVLIGNKKAGSASEPAADTHTLVSPLATGAFDIANLPRGIYEVYYTACFPDEGCFNGQYAFIGL